MMKDEVTQERVPGQLSDSAMARCLNLSQPLGMRIRICCTYPGTSLEPTEVTFTPRGLGERSDDVLEALKELLKRPHFEIETVGDLHPLPFASDTVQRVEIWEVRC